MNVKEFERLLELREKFEKIKMEVDVCEYKRRELLYEKRDLENKLQNLIAVDLEPKEKILFRIKQLLSDDYKLQTESNKVLNELKVLKEIIFIAKEIGREFR